MFLRNSLRMSLATQTPQRPLRIRRSFPSSGEISIPAMRAQKTTSTALRYAVSRPKDARRQLRSSVSRNNVKCECCRFSSNGQRGRVGAALPSLKRCCAHGEFAWFILFYLSIHSQPSSHRCIVALLFFNIRACSLPRSNFDGSILGLIKENVLSTK